MRSMLALLLLCALARPAPGDTLKGKVVLVSEGDLLTIQSAGGLLTVRLQGVDCPEPGQPRSDQARQLTASLTLGKTVTVSLSNKGAGSHRLGRVCLEARCLDEELLRAGLAWQERSQPSPELAALEQQARTARRGLWADPRPIPPWKWREQHSPPLRGTLIGETAGHPAIDVSYPVCVEPRTRVAHWFTCDAAKGLSCKLQTAAQARAAGFTLHRCLTQQAAGERSCRKHSDCVFKPRSRCGCPPCGEHRREAVNRKEAARLRRQLAAEKCPLIDCAKCPLRWLGTRPFCHSGLCDVR